MSVRDTAGRDLAPELVERARQTLREVPRAGYTVLLIDGTVMKMEATERADALMRRISTVFNDETLDTVNVLDLDTHAPTGIVMLLDDAGAPTLHDGRPGKALKVNELASAIYLCRCVPRTQARIHGNAVLVRDALFAREGLR